MPRFVEGEPLDWRITKALRIAGNTLGTIHRVLLEDGALELRDQLFRFLAARTKRPYCDRTPYTSVTSMHWAASCITCDVHASCAWLLLHGDDRRVDADKMIRPAD